MGSYSRCQAWKIKHTLTDIIFLTIAVVIASAEGWEDIEDFGEDNLEWLRQYGDFKQGIPVHDTIARVINLISAKQLQRCFTAWMKDCHEVTEGEVIAIEGKTLRGTYNKDKRCGAIHMVSAFSTANQVVLGQVKTADKSNEIKAIPELLEMLSLQGCLVTIDAMGCQKDIAEKIVAQAVLNSFEGDKYVTQEKGHGRTETRLSMVVHNTDFLGYIAFDWA
ncbi:ISAs1 family transposase, partial [Vibrio sp. F13]|uniref:ISAs1 family transposase n=2 Tax=unclassified Vibrio TaxID=2614977 RepID=UPI001F0DCC8C